MKVESGPMNLLIYGKSFFDKLILNYQSLGDFADRLKEHGFPAAGAYAKKEIECKNDLKSNFTPCSEFKLTHP